MVLILKWIKIYNTLYFYINIFIWQITLCDFCLLFEMRLSPVSQFISGPLSVLVLFSVLALRSVADPAFSTFLFFVYICIPKLFARCLFLLHYSMNCLLFCKSLRFYHIMLQGNTDIDQKVSPCVKLFAYFAYISFYNF